MSFYVYILYSERHDTFYIGQTNDITDRLRRHNAGMEKAIASYTPWKLILSIMKSSRSEAVTLERKIKNLNKIRLDEFIDKYKGID